MDKRDRERKERLDEMRRQKAKETKEKQELNRQRIVATQAEREHQVECQRLEFDQKQQESIARRLKFEEDRRKKEEEAKQQALKKVCIVCILSLMQRSKGIFSKCRSICMKLKKNGRESF